MSWDSGVGGGDAQPDGTAGVDGCEREVAIVNKYGLHARPAMQFVDLANRFESRISVSNGASTFDAKSIMEVLQLGATKGSVLHLTADGEDAERAIQALVDLVRTGFGEE